MPVGYNGCCQNTPRQLRRRLLHIIMTCKTEAKSSSSLNHSRVQLILQVGYLRPPVSQNWNLECQRTCRLREAKWARDAGSREKPALARSIREGVEE
jgi:hypothetical protein